MEQIKIKYHDKDMPKLEKIGGNKSDWIDLRSTDRIELHTGQFAMIDLGVSMEIPQGYEAHLVPRSSTFLRYGIIQTNSVGIIDQKFCGNNDVWKLPVYATRDSIIEKYDRVAQFRIVKKQPPIMFKKVEQLHNEDRSGFGSTGVK